MASDDIVDAEAGSGTDNFVTGIVVFTTVALVFGFILVQMALKNYDRGMF